MSKQVVEKIKRKITEKPSLQRFDGDTWHNNYPNIGAYTKALETYILDFESYVLGILEDYAVEPYVLTLCDKCNKEFPIKFEETATEWIAVFARCPHCNHSSNRWLKITKKQGEFVVVKKQKLRELENDIIGYLNDYDVVKFLEQNNVKYDSWLKNQFFKLFGDVRTEIIMKFSKFGVESAKKEKEREKR